MKKLPEYDPNNPPSKEEIFEKLNASAQRTLDSLMAAYETGMKAGISEEEQDQVIELMRRAKDLRDQLRNLGPNQTDQTKSTE